MSNLIDIELLLSQKHNLSKTDGLLDLTSENVAKVEAMIRYDSAYRKASSADSAPNKKYKGSTPYWIKQFSDLIKSSPIDEQEYKNLIRKIVESVDRENSTHLNSDKVGIVEISDRICSYEPKELIELLRKPTPDYKLIKNISLPTHPTGKSHKGNDYKARINFSFATKFCHYMAINLFAGESEADNFSIYDNVLDKAIRLYKDDEVPGNKHHKKIVFEGNYETYINFIDDIILQRGNEISRNGFDHLLWYYYKGE
jgi:hypothetical protein